MQRYQSNTSEEQEVLREDIVRLASTYGRYGYRRITALLRAEGWVVNPKRDVLCILSLPDASKTRV